MAAGTVKKLVSDRGFGFIAADEDEHSLINAELSRGEHLPLVGELVMIAEMFVPERLKGILAGAFRRFSVDAE